VREWLTECASGARDSIWGAAGASVVLGTDTENDVLELASGSGQVALGHHAGERGEVAGGRVGGGGARRCRQAIGGRREEGNGGDEGRDKHDERICRSRT
jgi:hypothetical protein